MIHLQVCWMLVRDGTGERLGLRQVRELMSKTADPDFVVTDLQGTTLQGEWFLSRCRCRNNGVKDLDCVGLGRDSKNIESRSPKEMSFQVTIHEMGLSGERSKEISDKPVDQQRMGQRRSLQGWRTCVVRGTGAKALKEYVLRNIKRCTKDKSYDKYLQSPTHSHPHFPRILFECLICWDTAMGEDGAHRAF